MRTLETKRLLLRDWREDDVQYGVHAEATLRYLLRAQNNYAVVYKENGRVIGTIGLNEDADGNPDTRNVGVRILEEYRNKGLMSEALACVVASSGDIAKSLSWIHAEGDRRSAHLAEKLGFQYVKTFANVCRAEGAPPVNMLYYRKLL